MGAKDLALPQGLQHTLQLVSLSPVPTGTTSAEPGEGAEIVEVDTKRMEAGGNVGVVTGHGSLDRAMPSNILQARAALSSFDCSTHWGPRLSVTRRERLARRRRCPGPPAGWGWVDAILLRFPTLGEEGCGCNGAAAARVPPPGLCPPSAHTMNSLPVWTPDPGAQSSPGEALITLGIPTLVAPVQPEASEPVWENPNKHSHFTRTLKNVGNTCFFNATMQAVASIGDFVRAIKRIALPPDHTGNAYCLAIRETRTVVLFPIRETRTVWHF